MQSKFQAFFSQHAFALAFCATLAVFLVSVSPAHAQGGVVVQGFSTSGESAPDIKQVKSKGSGEADVTIAGVVLKSSLKYCLFGVGRGNWPKKLKDQEGKEQEGFDLTTVACANSKDGVVVLSVKNPNFKTRPVIGYVPVSIDAAGKIVNWQPKPTKSLSFENSKGQMDEVIALAFAADGSVRIATAAEAMTIND